MSKKVMYLCVDVGWFEIVMRPGLDRFGFHAIIIADSEVLTGNGEISGDLYSK
jgi:hypothetical protein